MTDQKNAENSGRADDLDLDALDDLDIPETDIEYQVQDDSGCEGGACKI